MTDGDLTDCAVWTPPKKATRPGELRDYYDSFTEWLDGRPVDLAVVAQLAMSRGHTTTRVLAHFESPTYIVLERRSIPILTIKDGEARNWALGLKITSTKEEAHEEVRRRYPKIKVPPMNRGGGDVLDAFVAALAGPEALRRLKR